jgi:precorrin-6B methylase 2
MKTSLFVSLLVLSSSFSAFAQMSGTRKAVVTTAGAASMVTGYAAAKKIIRVADIEKKFIKVIYQVNANFTDPEYAANGVKEGDSIRITFSENNRLQVVQERVGRLGDELTQIRALHVEQLELVKRYSQDNHRFFHLERANPAAAKEHAQQAARFKQIFVAKAAEYKRSLAQIEEMTKPKTIVIRNATPEIVSSKLAELRDLNFSVYTVKRVPGAVLSKLAKVSKGGVIMAGAAITVGLVTAEEIISGKIASSLDSEYAKLKK